MSHRKPINSAIESLIQERAMGLREPEVFGTSEAPERIGLESLLPAYVKTHLFPNQLRVSIGSWQCKQPYSASIFNCAALSFGPMSAPFILAVNQAAYQGQFFQNTGEAGISPYHFGQNVDIEAPEFDLPAFFKNLQHNAKELLQSAGDVVWQLGTGYFGCRNADGSFNPGLFQQKSQLENVKMIEIKLSQGVEPCKEIPVKHITPGITKILGIHDVKEAKIQQQHGSFSTPIELLRFLKTLRQLSGGKPVGIKLGMTHKYLFLALCKAMLKTGILPDYICVDGMEAGSAAAYRGASGYTGTPLNDALIFAHNALVGINVRDQVRIIASGRIFTERDIISKLARGADLCLSARAVMLSAGCNQQRECHKGLCQKGIATQDPVYTAEFDIAANAARIANFHRITLEELSELLCIAGLTNVNDLGPGHIQRRTSPFELKTLAELYDFIAPGALKRPFSWQMPKSFASHWALADPSAPFSRQPKTLSLHK